MKRPLVVNVKEYGSSVWTVIRLYSINSIGSTAANPEVGLVVSLNGLQYTTDKTPDELERMVAECCADLKVDEPEKVDFEAAPKKSSAIALYLIVAGLAGIGEDGSVVDTRDFPEVFHDLFVFIALNPPNQLIRSCPKFSTPFVFSFCLNFRKWLNMRS